MYLPKTKSTTLKKIHPTTCRRLVFSTKSKKKSYIFLLANICLLFKSKCIAGIKCYKTCSVKEANVSSDVQLILVRSPCQRERLSGVNLTISAQPLPELNGSPQISLPVFDYLNIINACRQMYTVKYQ